MDPGTDTVRHSRLDEPLWEIATLYPPQGRWSEAAYLALETNRLIEFDNGRVEFLPMPTTSHQKIVMALYGLLLAFLGPRGTVLPAPLRLRVADATYREPDLLVALAAHAAFTGEAFWTGADLVVEVVSPGSENRERDLVDKRADYARAGIPEYWIVDPAQAAIRVLVLEAGAYTEPQPAARAGQVAVSCLLPGFAVAVDAVLPRAQ